MRPRLRALGHDEQHVPVLQAVDVDDADPAAVVDARDHLGVPAGHQQPSAVDVLGIAGVGRRGDALGPPSLRGDVRVVPAVAPLDDMAGDGTRTACRFRFSSTPARPTRRPSCCSGDVDVRGVLVGTTQVDACQLVPTHPANLGQAPRDRFTPMREVVGGVARRRPGAGRSSGQPLAPSPGSGSSPVARSSRGRTRPRPRCGRSPRSSAAGSRSPAGSKASRRSHARPGPSASPPPASSRATRFPPSTTRCAGCAPTSSTA